MNEAFCQNWYLRESWEFEADLERELRQEGHPQRRSKETSGLTSEGADPAAAPVTISGIGSSAASPS
jgi:hypothetical protein